MSSRAIQTARYSVQCFFDDDLGKLGKRIHGVEVKGTISQVQERLRAMDIQEIIVAIPSAGENRRHEILQKLSGLERIKISVLPSTLDMIRQKPMRSQLREVRIEDLLGREPVYLDPAPVDAYLSGKTVLSLEAAALSVQSCADRLSSTIPKSW